jgi:very-short-patch-repair endonuclease
MWSLLRGKRLAAFKFRRQVPIGDYIVDFLCFAQRLCVELDGPSHDGREEYDFERTRFLESKGYRVLRIPNDEVYKDAERVAGMIMKVLEGEMTVTWERREPSPGLSTDRPPLQGEE